MTDVDPEALARAQLDVRMSDKRRLEKLSAAFKAAGLDPAELGSIERIRFYEGFHKDDDGQAHVVPMTSFVINPAWSTGPEWPVVQPAAPTVVKARPARQRAKVPLDGWRRAVILPDPQIGFRLLDDGTLDPFHDETAIAVALSIVADVQPDLIVNLGDFLDLPAWGKYEQEPAFQRTTQPSLDRAHLFLAEQRAAAPDADIVLLEGNHDRRLQKAIVRNAMEAFGLRRANTPDSWPVLSIQHLLRLDDLAVTYQDGYPANEYWINENLVCIHGHRVKSDGSTAALVIREERASVIMGHVHRIEEIHKSWRVRRGDTTVRKQNLVATPGTLARVDGAVPSVKGSTDALGRPVPTYENWQQGCALVTYQPDDGHFRYEAIPIHNGWAIHHNQEHPTP